MKIELKEKPEIFNFVCYSILTPLIFILIKSQKYNNKTERR